MAGIVLEDNCHFLLRIPVSVLRQASRPTKNPILTRIIQLGPSPVDYGLGANPIPAPDGIQQRLHANILEQPERLTVQPGPLHLTRRQDLAFRVTPGACTRIGCDS